MQREAHDTLLVTFDVPPHVRELFLFTQGQHVRLRATIRGEHVGRSYSICSAVGDAVRVAIKRVAGGRFSSWAHETLVVGATVDVALPDGRFHVPLNADQVRRYLGIAAGSGITPLLSIIKTTLATEPLSRFTLIYANRTSSRIVFRDELRELEERYADRFVMLSVMSREPQESDLLFGRIDAAKCAALWRSWIDVSTVDTAFICVPEPLTRVVSSSLQAHGLPEERIKVESFATETGRNPTVVAPHERAANATCTAFVVLDGREHSFVMERRTETILDAGLRHGIDLPYSCKGGICATCAVVLVDGEVEMDIDDALEDEEIARGLILMCQSYAITDTVRLNIDAQC